MLPELTARLVHQDITPAPASRLVLARQTICGLAAALPGRDIHVVADAACAGKERWIFAVAPATGSALVASKIRRPSRPSMATRAKSFRLADSRAAVSRASNCRCVKPSVGDSAEPPGGGHVPRVSAPARRR